MHAASPTDFLVPVKDVGDFVFAKRTMADHLRINVEYAKMTEGVMPTPWLDTIVTCMACIKVLAVRVPEGFDIDAMDPLDDKTYTALMDVHAALRAKEASFRGKPAPGSEGSRQAPVSDP